MKRLLGALLVLALLMTGLAGCQSGGGDAKKELIIYTWADYIPQDIIEEFEQATGITVTYTYFTSNEEMLTRLQAVNGGEYDLVLASDYIIDIARKEGLLQKLDKSKISTFGDIDPNMQGQYYDENDEYVVPYAAGTPLIIYDPAKVDIEITGYEDLWNPALKDSIVIMDDARNVLGITLKTMGESFNVTDPATIKAAGDKLLDLKPNIRALDYDTPYDKMISGETTVGYMFTPQVVWALDARPDLKVVYPKEGMGFGIDSFFIPSQAPNADSAHQFLEYILQGEVSARLSEFTMYINCVTTAKEFLPEEYLSNQALYIPSDVLGNTEFIEDVGDATELYMDEWTRFKQ